jgi:hypothetical protein
MSHQLVEIAPRQWCSADSVKMVEADGVYLTIQTDTHTITHEFGTTQAATHRLHDIISAVNGFEVSQYRKRSLNAHPINTSIVKERNHVEL